MTFNVVSDLHCVPSNAENDFGFHTNWYDFEPEKLEPADYLVVAGDMGLFENHVDVIKELQIRTKGKFKDILWILGNHDYWVHEDERWFSYKDEDLTEPCKNHTIDKVDGDVAIIGTTLWTNSCKFSELRYMNDYRRIPAFKPEIKVKRFEEESKWLREKWLEYKGQGKKVVIVTHHNPRGENQLPEMSWEHSEVYTAYWVVNGVLDDIKPDLWICGHIHENFDGVVDGVRFVRHPIGYRWGLYHLDVKKFPKYQAIIDSWYNKVVEV